MSLKRRLSQVLGAIKKGYAVDTLQGEFPLVQTEVAYGAASAVQVLASTVLTAAEQEVDTGLALPTREFRALSVTGNQASVAGIVSIAGRDWAGRAFVENITLSGVATVLGDRPFKDIDKVTLPVLVGAGDAVSVGMCDKIGLKRPIEATEDYLGLLRKAQAATEFSAEAGYTVNATYGTVLPGTIIVANDSFQLAYETEIF